MIVSLISSPVVKAHNVYCQRISFSTLERNSRSSQWRVYGLTSTIPFSSKTFRKIRPFKAVSKQSHGSWIKCHFPSSWLHFQAKGTISYYLSQCPLTYPRVSDNIITHEMLVQNYDLQGNCNWCRSHSRDIMKWFQTTMQNIPDA